MIYPSGGSESYSRSEKVVSSGSTAPIVPVVYPSGGSESYSSRSEKVVSSGSAVPVLYPAAAGGSERYSQSSFESSGSAPVAPVISYHPSSSGFSTHHSARIHQAVPVTVPIYPTGGSQRYASSEVSFCEKAVFNLKRGSFFNYKFFMFFVNRFSKYQKPTQPLSSQLLVVVVNQSAQNLAFLKLNQLQAQHSLSLQVVAPHTNHHLTVNRTQAALLHKLFIPLLHHKQALASVSLNRPRRQLIHKFFQYSQPAAHRRDTHTVNASATKVPTVLLLQ